MKHVEIIPDEMGGFEAYGRQYRVSPAVDVIMRFVDHDKDYLQYLDPEAAAITFHWLGSSALATLAGWGIPESRERLKMPESIYNEYLEWQANLGMAQFEQEVADIPEPTEGFGDAA